jgi:hypothetical protein
MSVENLNRLHEQQTDDLEEFFSSALFRRGTKKVVPVKAASLRLFISLWAIALDACGLIMYVKVL